MLNLIQKYVNLTQNSKTKLVSVAERLERCGITSKDALKLSDFDLKQIVGFKGKKSSFDGFKRNIKEISFDLERKKGVLNDSLPKYTKLGYRGKGLNLVKVRLNKTLGLNTFFDIAKEVQKKFGLSESESWSKTRDTLALANVSFKQLLPSEKEVLEYFS